MKQRTVLTKGLCITMAASLLLTPPLYTIAAEVAPQESVPSTAISQPSQTLEDVSLHSGYETTKDYIGDASGSALEVVATVPVVKIDRIEAGVHGQSQKAENHVEKAQGIVEGEVNDRVDFLLDNSVEGQDVVGHPGTKADDSSHVALDKVDATINAANEGTMKDLQEVYDQIDAGFTNLNDANAALTKVEDLEVKAQGELAQAQNELNDAALAVSIANARFEVACEESEEAKEAALEELNKAKAHLAKAEKAAADAQAKVNGVYNVFDRIESEIASLRNASQEALENSEENLKQKKEDLANSVDALKTAANEEDGLVDSVDKFVEQVGNFTEAAGNFGEALAEAGKAQNKVDGMRQDHRDAVKALDEANKALEEAAKDLSETEKAYYETVAKALDITVDEAKAMDAQQILTELEKCSESASLIKVYDAYNTARGNYEAMEAAYAVYETEAALAYEKLLNEQKAVLANPEATEEEKSAAVAIIGDMVIEKEVVGEGQTLVEAVFDAKSGKYVAYDEQGNVLGKSDKPLYLVLDENGKIVCGYTYELVINDQGQGVVCVKTSSASDKVKVGGVDYEVNFGDALTWNIVVGQDEEGNDVIVTVYKETDDKGVANYYVKEEVAADKTGNEVKKVDTDVIASAKVNQSASACIGMDGKQVNEGQHAAIVLKLGLFGDVWQNFAVTDGKTCTLNDTNYEISSDSNGSYIVVNYTYLDWGFKKGTAKVYLTNIGYVKADEYHLTLNGTDYVVTEDEYKNASVITTKDGVTYYISRTTDEDGNVTAVTAEKKVNAPYTVAVGENADFKAQGNVDGVDMNKYANDKLAAELAKTDAFGAYDTAKKNYETADNQWHAMYNAAVKNKQVNEKYDKDTMAGLEADVKNTELGALEQLPNNVFELAGSVNVSVEDIATLAKYLAKNGNSFESYLELVAKLAVSDKLLTEEEQQLVNAGKAILPGLDIAAIAKDVADAEANKGTVDLYNATIGYFGTKMEYSYKTQYWLAWKDMVEKKIAVVATGADLAVESAKLVQSGVVVLAEGLALTDEAAAVLVDSIELALAYGTTDALKVSTDVLNLADMIARYLEGEIYEYKVAADQAHEDVVEAQNALDALIAASSATSPKQSEIATAKHALAIANQRYWDTKATLDELTRKLKEAEGYKEKAQAEIRRLTPVPTPGPAGGEGEGEATPVMTVAQLMATIAPVAGAPAPAAEEIEIPEEETPLSVEDTTAEKEPVVIEEEETPLAGRGSWSFLNLLLALLSAVCVILLLAETNYAKIDDKSKLIFRIVTVAIAVAAAATFVLTGNILGKMQLFDKWTVLMGAYFVVQVALVIVARQQKLASAKAENK